jgi:hypothetical protein
MGKTSVLVIAAALTFAAMPSSALAESGDAAATQAYIQANSVLVHAAWTRLGTSEAALTRLLDAVRRECPSVAAESPQDYGSEQLSNEVVLAMRVAAVKPDIQAIADFTRAVKGLSWSNHKLTSTIRTYAAQLKALSTLAAPNLCADVKAWVLSAYQTLSASTTQFARHFEALNVAIGELPEPLLAPSERPGERSILHHTSQLEAQLTEGEARAVEPWGEIMNTLDLNP